MGIRNSELKKLYGLSAGRCNICQESLFENDVHIGEMAHVIAKKSNGPRGNEISCVSINSYKNLILLCANHHSEVDQNPSFYTVEKLHQIKHEHENHVALSLSSPSQRNNDIDFLKIFMQFVPFTRIESIAYSLPYSVHLDFSLIGDMFKALQINNPHLYPLNDKNLHQYFNNFIQKYYQLWRVIEGTTDVDGKSHHNFSQADLNSRIYMQREYLSHEAAVRLSNNLDKLSSDFLCSYHDLIAFLRANYKEVDLNSYIPY